jgi:5-methylcytosine-specific restriction endonuclease McrA
MSIPNPNINKGGRPWAPLLRSQIEDAQQNSNSSLGAARYLGVSHKRYKRYAQLYGIFEQHLNQRGVGVDKGWAKRPSSTPLRDILAGKHPKYSLARLKNRLIARKKLIPECSLCGFNEKRITDNQVPLMINFKDGDHKNFILENLELLCYNCMFLTSGAPTVVNRKQISKSFTNPEKIPKKHSIAPAVGDSYDPTDDILLEESSIELTADERQALLDEL